MDVRQPDLPTSALDMLPKDATGGLTTESNASAVRCCQGCGRRYHADCTAHSYAGTQVRLLQYQAQYTLSGQSIGRTSLPDIMAKLFKVEIEKDLSGPGEGGGM